MDKNTPSDICILHDTFIYQGGAERLMIMMARVLSADLASAYFDVGSFDPRAEGVTGRIIPLAKRWKNRYLSQLKLQYDFFFHTGFLKEYSTVMVSGDCLSALRHVASHAHVVYYCHTPPRYLFDQREAYEQKIPPILRPLYRLYIALMSKLYLRSLSRVNTIYTNSLNTQARIMEFTGRDSIVLYPPVDTGLFIASDERLDYYLSYARLSTIKRIDVIVRAFQQMPDKKLIIHHGTNDPQIREIETLIMGYPNIELIHLDTQEELRDKIARSLAVVYVPEDEDFGMIPLEAMSCGVPVIGVNQGGLRETILHEKTGWLLEPNNLEHDIVSLVGTLERDTLISMQRSCIERALEFDLRQFEEQVKLSIMR